MCECLCEVCEVCDWELGFYWNLFWDLILDELRVDKSDGI